MLWYLPWPATGATAASYETLPTIPKGHNKGIEQGKARLNVEALTHNPRGAVHFSRPTNLAGAPW